MSCNGPACGEICSSTLAIRLHELTEAAIVAPDDRGGYVLTDLGATLPTALHPMIDWSETRAKKAVSTEGGSA